MSEQAEETKPMAEQAVDQQDGPAKEQSIAEASQAVQAAEVPATTAEPTRTKPAPLASSQLSEKQRNMLTRLTRYRKRVESNMIDKEKLRLVKVDRSVHNAYFYSWGRDCMALFRLAVRLRRRTRRITRNLKS